MLFESHAHHLRHLVQTGKRARADVLERHEGSSTDLGYTSDYVNHPRAAWEHLKLVVMVHPDGEQPFKATIRTKWYPMADYITVGEQIAVWYDPEDEDRRCLIDYEGALTKWELSNLDSLHGRGDVTEEEYQAKRAEILERREQAGSPPLDPSATQA